MRKLSVLLLVMTMLGAGREVQAHVESTSFLVVETEEAGEVSARWDLALHDLIWSVFVDADFDGLATWQEIQAARGSISSAVLAQIRLARGGAACGLMVRDLALVTRAEQGYLSVELRAQCPSPGLLSVGGPLFMTGDASQRVMLSAHRDGAAMAGVLSAAVPVWNEPARDSAWASFARFIGEGVWHVLIGYDHIAFVLLLLLPSVVRPVAGRWQGAEGIAPVARDIITMVTAFTVAHSITLALAATGTLVPPARPIELAIAASIAAAALVNLLPRLAGWRLPLAFGFGLVHGFGFANVLGEINAAGAALLPLLAGFNVGVELAQLGIVAMVLPAIYFMRRSRWYADGLLPLASCALGAAGLVWLVQRL